MDLPRAKKKKATYRMDAILQPHPGRSGWAIVKFCGIAKEIGGPTAGGIFRRHVSLRLQPVFLMTWKP